MYQGRKRERRFEKLASAESKGGGAENAAAQGVLSNGSQEQA
jgi:hypothetical protein